MLTLLSCRPSRQTSPPSTPESRHHSQSSPIYHCLPDRRAPLSAPNSPSPASAPLYRSPRTPPGAISECDTPGRVRLWATSSGASRTSGGPWGSRRSPWVGAWPPAAATGTGRSVARTSCDPRGPPGRVASGQNCPGLLWWRRCGVGPPRRCFCPARRLCGEPCGRWASCRVHRHLIKIEIEKYKRCYIIKQITSNE